MRSRLAFGVSMGIHFETYLVDEVTAVGDAAFREKSELLFAERITQSGAVMVTHNMAQVKRLCTLAGVLEDGRLSFYDDVDEAIAHHQELMKASRANSG